MHYREIRRPIRLGVWRCFWARAAKAAAAHHVNCGSRLGERSFAVSISIKRRSIAVDCAFTRAFVFDAIYPVAYKTRSLRWQWRKQFKALFCMKKPPHIEFGQRRGRGSSGKDRDETGHNLQVDPAGVFRCEMQFVLRGSKSCSDT